jgi:DNA-binding transcriptional ArsR family regulator
MQTEKFGKNHAVKNRTPANARQIARLLRVLANENRLLIFCALMDSPLSVSQIAENVPAITQPALSQHLALLKAHGILDSVKSGQNITYSIADHRVEEIIRVLEKHYCQ